jgi:hypothetical protein
MKEPSHFQLSLLKRASQRGLVILTEREFRSAEVLSRCGWVVVDGDRMMPVYETLPKGVYPL